MRIAQSHNQLCINRQAFHKYGQRKGLRVAPRVLPHRRPPPPAAAPPATH